MVMDNAQADDVLKQSIMRLIQDQFPEEWQALEGRSIAVARMRRDLRTQHEGLVETEDNAFQAWIERPEDMSRRENYEQLSNRVIRMHENEATLMALQREETIARIDFLKAVIHDERFVSFVRDYREQHPDVSLEHILNALPRVVMGSLNSTVDAVDPGYADEIESARERVRESPRLRGWAEQWGLGPGSDHINADRDPAQVWGAPEPDVQSPDREAHNSASRDPASVWGPEAVRRDRRSFVERERENDREFIRRKDENDRER